MGVVLVGTKVLLGSGGGMRVRSTPIPPVVLPTMTLGTPSGVVEGVGNIAFVATLSATTSEDVTVDYATANGTALAATHYTAASGTLTIAAGLLTGTITVTVLNPAGYHGTKQFTLTLSNADHNGDAITITTATRTGTILDDETNPAPGAHAYYEDLIARPDLYDHESMRSQASYNAGTATSGITYDYAGDPYALKQDAAKVVIAENTSSLQRAWKRPTPLPTAGGPFLITWDAWFGEEFQTERDVVTSYKTFNILDNHTNAGLCYEVRTKLDAGALPASIGTINVRTYGDAAPTGFTNYGDNVTDGDPLAPQLNQFTIAPNTWTRYWVLVDLKRAAGPPEVHDTWSMWVADETQDAVQLFDALKFNTFDVKGPGTAIKQFYWEYNTSQSGRVGAALVGYVRNLVVLEDPSDVATLILTKPVGD